jgi:hypothetical protein
MNITGAFFFFPIQQIKKQQQYIAAVLTNSNKTLDLFFFKKTAYMQIIWNVYK